MHRRIKHGILLAVALCTASAQVSAETIGSVRHLPPAEAEPAKELEIVANVSRGWESNLELRFRPFGSVSWQSVTFTRRDSTTYVAAIPAEAVTPPGFEYFIMTTGPENQTRFASAEMPHRVNVFHSAREVRKQKHLSRHDNRRAKIRLAAERVDYGTREINGQQVADAYNRIDAEVSYRMLNFPLKTLSFGYTYLVGETPPNPGTPGCNDGTLEDECVVAGFRGSGWFQLRFLLTDGVEFDARGVVMATPTGFNVGGRGELRIGDADGTHLGIGTEILADVGTSGHIRLGWGTVPGFPMAATVEVTDFPAPHRQTAIRLIYDISRSLPKGIRIGGRIGYQARDQQIGGLTLGVNTALEF